MLIKKIIHHVENLGLPRFWQFYVLLHIIFSGFLVFISNETVFHISNIILTSLVSIGVIAGIFHYKDSRYPWEIFTLGIILISISVVLVSLNSLGFKTGGALPTYIEEAGMILFSLFSYKFMRHLEKEFNLNGFTIDYSLMVISSFLLVLLIAPNFLSIFINDFSISQKLVITNLVFSIGFFIMVILHHVLTLKIFVKDVIRISSILFLILHFAFELKLSFSESVTDSLLIRISWSIYQLAGSFAILFTFLERFSVNAHQNTNIKISPYFMWVASILAILVIPIGIIIRDRLGYPPFEALAIGIAGFSLSSVVIWRFQILINNNNQQRKKLQALAHTDTLTNLPNYHGYLEVASNLDNKNMLVLNINVEDFKSINDLYGRPFGDEVLKSLAIRLTKLQNILVVSRTGSDVFMAVFHVSVGKVELQLKVIQKELNVWDTVKERRIAVPLTFGASYGNNPEALAIEAEKALKIARNKHLSCYLYTTKNTKTHLPRHELRGIMQQALDLNFLPIHFQPIYNIQDGSLKALELLIRLQSKEHGLLLPGQFLEQAQVYGLLTPLTKVCVNMIAKHYEQLPDVTININIPSYMLDNPRILNEFLNCFQEAKLPANRFCIEVMEDQDIPPEHLLCSVKLLKQKGFLIAMDDFGTGYSSLSRLSMLPFDTVKIDRSLLLAATSGNKAILESTITLIKRLGLSVVVEGVETLEQLALVRLLGADSVQGFLLSKPVDIKATTKLPLNAANIIAEF